MTPNNNLSVLPWYDSINRQNHRRDYAYGNIYQLITPDRKLLPFQIRRSTRTNEILQVLLRNIEGKQIADITSQIKETGLTVKRFSADGYDLIIYPGILPMAITTPEGLYYAEISDGVQRWYSEIFNIVRTVDEYMKIEWWDEATVRITYFIPDCRKTGGVYESVTGRVRELDAYGKVLVLTDKRTIPLENLWEIEW